MCAQHPVAEPVKNRPEVFLILSIRRVLCVVCFLSGNSPASIFKVPMKMEPIECTETSAIRTQTPGNYPKENILQA
jgi:hypothetical protein